MARWAAFLGLTAVVITLFLVLARLSQGAVRGDRPQPPRSEVHDERSRSFPDAVGDTSGPPRTRSTDSRSSPRGAEQLSTGVLLANVVLTQGLFGAIVAAGAWYFEIPASDLGLGGGPWTGGVPALGLGLAFGVVLWGGNEVAAGLADAAGATYDEELREMLAPEGIGGWAILLGAVLPIVAVVEEFLFRAAFIGATTAGFGTSPWALAVVSSAAFALGHGAQGRAGVVVTGALGFVLAAGFVLTGSLLVVVVAHYAVNALEFLVHEAAGVDRLR